MGTDSVCSGIQMSNTSAPLPAREVAGEIARPAVAQSPRPRIISIDALRGLVVFMMIFVNYLAGAGKVVPDWMVHFSERHRGGSGMTFVDLVFPAFLFIVGMSIPQALGGRLSRGESTWSILTHVFTRTASLLLIGILMVHETPDTAMLGWPGSWWCALMYLSSIAAFGSFRRSGEQKWAGVAQVALRVFGLVTLAWLAFAFRGPKGERIISLAPLSLSTEWYGILGLIGWAYLVSSVVFLVFRANRTALLGCVALLMCLFAADRKGAFEGFWLNHIVGIGGTLGSLSAISVSGLLLGSMLADDRMGKPSARAKFTAWFIAGCAAAALLLNPLYGISKNAATPSWCFWASAITAALWYGFYQVCDLHPLRFFSGSLARAGKNVLLAYLISEMIPSLLDALHLGAFYTLLGSSLPAAILCSVACSVVILLLSTGLNRLGFMLRL
jgi:predicted acyltransferase